MARRKRGAQPGNSNARTHGFYADAVGPKARRILRRAFALDPDDIEHEIALMRTKMHQLSSTDPDNLSILTLAGGLLVRLVALQHGLNANEEHEIHESLYTLIKDLSPSGV